jgi:heterodisulfide reductase subunit B
MFNESASRPWGDKMAQNLSILRKQKKWVCAHCTKGTSRISNHTAKCFFLHENKKCLKLFTRNARH